MKPQLLVMAAGVGSRFGGLKQLEPVGPSGETVMDYALFDAKRAGLERVVFVIRRDFEQAFREQVGAKYERWMEVDYAFQELDQLPEGFSLPAGRTKPWGTGHAILAARAGIRTPFIAINADDFYGLRAFERLSEFFAGPSGAGTDAYAMVAFRMANTLSEHGTVARGVCAVGPDGLLETVVEHTGLERAGEGVQETAKDGAVRHFTGSEPVSMNFWGFQPSLFAHLQERFARFLAERGQDPKAEFFIPTVVDELIREGRATVRVLDTPDRWFGVTYREDKDAVVARIRALVEAGEYPRSLWS
ncbi:MAG TPA: NTP transferase domain-containing protein [Holophaga sp.]|nr:NTP transferase domain-containing protein [Holophaga sp.]